MTRPNKYKVDLQIVTKSFDIPNRFLIQRWVSETLSRYLPSAEVCIRIVDRDESQQLNAKYRKQNKPTNVLSFPSKLPESIKLDKHLIGDIVICADVVEEEAKAQDKLPHAHWAHMIVHGLLHLLGFDHQTQSQAEQMESKEIAILNHLGFSNPYRDEVNYER